MPPLAKGMIVLGGLLILAGLFIWLAGNKLNWFGHLPGDVRVERENFRFYAPIASMILLSILLSLLLWVIRRFF